MFLLFTLVLKLVQAGFGRCWPFLAPWNPQNEKLGKPYRAWYVMVNKKDWEADVDKLNNNSS